ncbi:hypothetical protein SNE40_015334 [Patella caerulea]|uniref:NADH dehydrogenase [ubiquinone] 1 beta subcomplex subunit 11, mitochondrial n=1 Tax=Patella caerulea TaxID=87958 RepID=A0AAN8PKN0_PATCE
MAGVWRALVKQGRLASQLNARTRIGFAEIKQCRMVSTSKSKKDATITSVEPMPKTEEMKKLEEMFGNTDPNLEKNWVSWGYSETDKDLDRFTYYVTLFIGLSLCICWGSFVVAYMPDYKMQDWCIREAYLEIERRQREGLPLVDPNHISAEKVAQSLPSDEELEDTEIII